MTKIENQGNSKVLLDTPFVHVAIQSSARFLYVKWLDASENMSEHDFMAVNHVYVRASENYDVDVVLINAQNFLFTIHPTLQDWVNNEIIGKMIANGLQKVAFVVSQELISQLSIEQTMETTQFSIYTATEEEAKKWLGVE
jgi:hypothetical protein